MGVDQCGVAVGCITEEGSSGVGRVTGEFVEGGREGVGKAAVGQEEGVDVGGGVQIVGDDEEQLVGEVEDGHGGWSRDGGGRGMVVEGVVEERKRRRGRGGQGGEVEGCIYGWW